MLILLTSKSTAITAHRTQHPTQTKHHPSITQRKPSTTQHTAHNKKHPTHGTAQPHNTQHETRHTTQNPIPNTRYTSHPTHCLYTACTMWCNSHQIVPFFPTSRRLSGPSGNERGSGNRHYPAVAAVASWTPKPSSLVTAQEEKRNIFKQIRSTATGNATPTGDGTTDQLTGNVTTDG